MDTYGNDLTGGARAGRRTFGIEEELLLVDPANGEAVPMARGLLNPVGVRVAALGTSPLPANPHPVQLRRFKAMAEEYGLTAREQLADGTGAVRQLEVLPRTGDLQRVAEDAANSTVAGS